MRTLSAVRSTLSCSQRCVGQQALYPRTACAHPLLGARHTRPVTSAGCPRATPDRGALDIRQLSDIISASALESEEKQHTLEQLAQALGEPLAAVRNMAFRQKALLSLDAAEVKSRIEKVAEIVEVPYDKARRMCVIQPSLITDTQAQAEALQYGLKLICHSLKAPRDEIVELILTHPSLLHGRQMRLSVADIAHLALLREPRGRIVD